MSKGLLVDYGGVLTSSAAQSFRDFEREVGLPKGAIFELIYDAYREPDGDNPIVRFERGESTAEEFAEAMAAALTAGGHEIDLDDMTVVERIFAGASRMPRMWALVGQARDAGVRTGLLSNSWGLEGYPVEDLDRIFDVLVISGEVGLRKPDPRIYLHAAHLIDTPPERCAFVDDLPRNVEAAQELGMFGVHHTDAATTAAELERFLGISLV
jgi:putative hydrolase of the HAD superfamily